MLHYKQTCFLEQCCLGSLFRLCWVNLYTTALQVRWYFITKQECWKMLMGYVCIQTYCYLLWDALLSVWTWLCISQAGLLRAWWYLVLQYTWDYFDFMGFLPWDFGLLRPNGWTRWLLAGPLCQMKCNLASASGYAYRFVIFSVTMCFCHFGHWGSYSHLIG